MACDRHRKLWSFPTVLMRSGHRRYTMTIHETHMDSYTYWYMIHQWERDTKRWCMVARSKMKDGYPLTTIFENLRSLWPSRAWSHASNKFCAEPKTEPETGSSPWNCLSNLTNDVEDLWALNLSKMNKQEPKQLNLRMRSSSQDDLQWL